MQFPNNRCSSYLLAQAGLPPHLGPGQLPAVTISRETCAGAATVASLVADRLQAEQKTPALPWAVFDRNLVEKVIEEHKLPREVNRYMAEDSRFAVREALEQILGLHPGTWTLAEHTSNTIYKLARHGNVVLVGRGANFIAADLPNVFHVRLVAPFDFRVRHCTKYYGLVPEKAPEFVGINDRARARYVLHHFNAHIADPLGYDLTINTGRTGFEEAARIVAEAVLRRMENPPGLQK